MKTNDTRKLSSEIQQHNRNTAIRLYKAGRSQRDIAALLGVHFRTVNAWIAAFKKGGSEALIIRKRGRASGDKRKLSGEQEVQLRLWLVEKTPMQMQLEYALWTASAIQTLIFNAWQIEVTPRTVRNYMQLWGLIPQKPHLRAAEGEPKKVQRWMAKTYPAIKANAKAQQAPIFWVDCSIVFDQLPGNYQPSERTGDLVDKNDESLRLISAFDNRWKVRFMICKGTITAKNLIQFFRYLIEENEQKVSVIIHHFPVRYARVAEQWLNKNRDIITVHFLPVGELVCESDERLNCGS